MAHGNLHNLHRAPVCLETFRISRSSNRDFALLNSVDSSVRIEANDRAAMQRLVEYIARCPFSLARIISLTDNGKILYRASASNGIPFPKAGDNELAAGNPRNFEIYEPLDFLATVTQHIPDKGEHSRL